MGYFTYFWSKVSHMAQVKFGMDQMSSPPPTMWRRFERAYMIVLVPALAAFLHGWGIADPVTLKRADLVIMFSIPLVKFIGVLLGNGQEYADRGIQNNQNT